jgi:hypothetical protein
MKKTEGHSPFKFNKSIVDISSVHITRVHVCPSIHMSACSDVPTSESTYTRRSSVCLHVHTSECMYMHMYVHACILAYVCKCLCEYVHTKQHFHFSLQSSIILAPNH